MWPWPLYEEGCIGHILCQWAPTRFPSQYNILDMQNKPPSSSFWQNIIPVYIVLSDTVLFITLAFNNLQCVLMYLTEKRSHLAQIFSRNCPSAWAMPLVFLFPPTFTVCPDQSQCSLRFHYCILFIWGWLSHWEGGVKEDIICRRWLTLPPPFICPSFQIVIVRYHGPFLTRCWLCNVHKIPKELWLLIILTPNFNEAVQGSQRVSTFFDLFLSFSF